MEGDEVLTVAAPGLLANDVDPDGDALTVKLVSEPLHGTLHVNSDGSFSYSAPAGFDGTVNFSYLVTDNSAVSNVVTVVVHVEGVGGPTTSIDSGPTATQEPETSEDSEISAEMSVGGIVPAIQTSSEPDQGERPENRARTVDESNTARHAVMGPQVTIDYIYQHEQEVDPFVRWQSGRDAMVSSVEYVPQATDEVDGEPEFNAKRLTVDETENDDSTGGTELVSFTASRIVLMSLTVTYVLWALKGGYLMTSFLSTLPAWRSVDPLAILDRSASRTPGDELLFDEEASLPL
jgi:hypothetical protein